MIIRDKEKEQEKEIINMMIDHMIIITEKEDQIIIKDKILIKGNRDHNKIDIKDTEDMILNHLYS